MKKVYLYIAILIIIIIIIGTIILIVNKSSRTVDIEESETETSTINDDEYNETEKEINANVVKVNSLNLKFTESNTSNDITYRYPRGSIVNSYDDSTTINYLKGVEANELAFRINIEKTIQKSIQDLVKTNNYNKVGNKTINQINWEVYSNENNTTKMYTCLTNKGELYKITIEADKDIENVEQEFMNSIVFK